MAVAMGRVKTKAGARETSVRRDSGESATGRTVNSDRRDATALHRVVRADFP